MKSSAYVMLGMLRVGSRTGYEIKRSATLSLRFFWAISPRQIYAELPELERRGLVRGADDPKGSLRRRTFELTTAGEDALRAWLEDPVIGDFEWRDLGLLKLFFADALPAAERVALARRLQRRAERTHQHFVDVIVPAAEKTRERHGNDMPAITAHFGREFWAWMSEWAARLGSDLEAAASKRSSGNRRPRG